MQRARVNPKSGASIFFNVFTSFPLRSARLAGEQRAQQVGLKSPLDPSWRTGTFLVLGLDVSGAVCEANVCGARSDQAGRTGLRNHHPREDWQLTCQSRDKRPSITH
jgi:hypothetical protein